MATGTQSGWNESVDPSRSAITSRALHQLRQDIILGVYAPGERLVEMALADTYKVSRGSLRTAFTILEKEGIIRTLANGRKVVIGLDLGYVRDLFGVRSILECQACQVILQRERTDYESLMKLLQLLNVVERGVEHEAYCRIDIEFHRAMVELSGNRALLQTWDSTAPVMLTLLRLNGEAGYLQEHVDTFIERHHRFVDLIMTRDPYLVEYARAHIMSGCDISCRRITAGRT